MEAVKMSDVVQAEEAKNSSDINFFDSEILAKADADTKNVTPDPDPSDDIIDPDPSDDTVVEP
jgi:hypothetical protein